MVLDRTGAACGTGNDLGKVQDEAALVESVPVAHGVTGAVGVVRPHRTCKRYKTEVSASICRILFVD
jgi:hypothetical protein